jgi:hypothetical protein
MILSCSSDVLVRLFPYLSANAHPRVAPGNADILNRYRIRPFIVAIRENTLLSRLEVWGVTHRRREIGER